MVENHAPPTTAALEPSTRVIRKPNLPWKELDGVAILLTLETGEYFELDEVGLFIWKLLDAETTVLECARRVVDAYDVPETEAVGDVLAFLDDLRERHLVTVR